MVRYNNTGENDMEIVYVKTLKEMKERLSSAPENRSRWIILGDPIHHKAQLMIALEKPMDKEAQSGYCAQYDNYETDETRWSGEEPLTYEEAKNQALSWLDELLS